MIVFKKIVLVFLFAKLIALCNQRIHFQSNQVYVRTHCPCNLLNVIAVFNVFQNGVVRERSLRSEDIGSIWGILGYTVLLCFTLFKTGALAKSVFSVH